LKADWSFKVEKLARSLHSNKNVAYEELRFLEKQKCYDDNCEGQMQVCGTKGVVKDADGYPHPKETYYRCADCGKKWVYDFQDNRVANW
jgi:hypothetical protein